MSDISELGTILGVWAHPDDETYCMAAIMWQAVTNGQRVTCVTATRGEAGSQDEERWPTATIARVREQELAEALSVLGVDDHRWLDYRDGHCHEVDVDEAAAKIAAIIEDVEPDSVLCFAPDGNTGHQDHIATCNWTTRAFKSAAKPGAKLYYLVNTTEWMEEWEPKMRPFGVFMTDDPPVSVPRSELAFNVELTSEMIDLKFKALQAQRSQTSGFIDAVGQDEYKRLIAEEAYILGAEK